ncbi:MAG: sigma 54-interacting transcriptional regulator [Nitrospiraceae bacterium]|nr:sigma 54-interacting transcriptional regulator [Nitrospiraceae bacterium]
MIEQFFQDPRFLAQIVETMRDGLMVVDAEGNILFFNKAAEEITGYRRDEVMGKQCTMIDSDTCVVLTDSGVQKSCDLFRTGAVCNKKCRIRSSDGRAVYLLKNAVVLKDSDETVVGAVETMTDITSLYMKELEIEELKQELRQEYWFMGLLGKSPAMTKLYEQIRNAAMSEAPVLICGESGAGKNLVANAIHKLSRRKDGPFITMNCASLNDHLLESELFGHKKGSFTGAVSDRIGRFEAANDGSIFLDEIGDMPLLMQAKLLRVLEEKVVERVGDHRPIPVNVRLISATNKDLHDLVPDKFREDLFYRVNSIFINVPPLRERVEDVPIIAFHYLKKISIVNNKDIRRISPQAVEVIKNYSWPGNVRQLINALEHSAITCKGDTIEVSDLPDYVFVNKKEETRGNQRDTESNIKSALAMFKGNKTLTAKHLGISRVTLWKRLKELKID